MPKDLWDGLRMIVGRVRTVCEYLEIWYHQNEDDGRKVPTVCGYSDMLSSDCE